MSLFHWLSVHLVIQFSLNNIIIVNVCTNNLLHPQSILAHRFPTVLVAAGFLLEEKALREPKGTVFPLSASNQHANHQDDQKEKRSYPHQHQLAPFGYRVSFKIHPFTCSGMTKVRHLPLSSFTSSFWVLKAFLLTTDFFEWVREAEHFYSWQGSKILCSTVSCRETVFSAQTVVYFQVHYGAAGIAER